MAAWLHAATALAAVYFRGTDALDAALGAREQADRTACPSAMAFARYVAAEARAHDGDAAAAHAELVDSLRLAEQVRAAFVAGLARLSLATLAVRVGNAWESLEHYEALLDMWRRSGNWVQQWNTLRTLVVALAELGRYDDAVQLLAGIDANAQTPRWGEDDARLVSADRKARQALGADRFAAAVEAGSGLSGIAVLEFAETCVARARRST
jgi:tetratricopeptide (TPR) repeat protein